MDKQDHKLEESLGSNNKFSFRLYITGSAPRSILAVNNITEICKAHLKDYELQIIDLYKNPEIAKQAQIIAVPTLVRISPLPERRIIGDMSDTEKVLRYLEIIDI